MIKHRKEDGYEAQQVLFFSGQFKREPCFRDGEARGFWQESVDVGSRCLTDND
ncbi:MAG: hypothetical protein HFG55_10875 [Lachnospiraceae bacterium]|nr:hypothetical protein [Lachnospiraceae bacterium]